jgi:hypothetical protein
MQLPNRKPVVVACALVVGTFSSTVPVAFAQAPEQNAASRVVFNVTKGPGILALEAGRPPQRALADSVVSGFHAAIDLWQGLLHDRATVNITFDYSLLDPSAIGAADPVLDGYDYATSVWPALVADSTSRDDSIAVGSLPSPLATGIDFITNDTTLTPSPRTRDANGSTNNTLMPIARANAKALGLLPADDPGADGQIMFSSRAAWDFDRSDGIDHDRVDFVGLAAHEIGHLLGFYSGTDVVDSVGGDGIAPEGPFAAQNIDLDPQGVFSMLDVFRYTNDSLSRPDQPTGGLRDFSFGQPAVGDRPFFSIDGGRTRLATFSTGRFNGDGFQASHWQNELALGVFIPIVHQGKELRITHLDLVALDAIGWDMASVPEPDMIMLAITAAWAFAVLWRHSTPIAKRRA